MLLLLQGREDVFWIKESFCSFYSLHPFMGDREQEEDEILKDRSLVGDQIQFLEVSDAFNAVDTDELPGYFKENGFVSSIPYVVWRKPYFSNITSLELDCQTMHQLFWILSEYLTLLNFEFNETHDQSTS